MLDAAALIEKYRAKGVLLDTNLLVLYLVGTVNRRRIPEFKRTQRFSIEDFELVKRLIAWFGKLFTTPHVLAQTSDLSALPGKELVAVRRIFKTVIEDMQEYFDHGRDIAADPCFEGLGLTDAAIAMACRHRLLVLTDDVALQLALQRRGMDALNFSHIRVLAWEGG